MNKHNRFARCGMPEVPYWHQLDFHGREKMKIRNSTMMIILIIVSLLVSGCGEATAGSSDAAATENASGLNDATQLALGILKLEDSGLAVTAEQAEGLLTLWQAYQALGNSETTAAVELEAVVNQIKSTLTSDQVEAIDAFGLTNDSIAEVMQGLGMDFGGSGMPQAQGTQEAATGFRNFQGGEMPPGGNLPGGGEMPSGGFQRGGGEMQMDETMGEIMGAQGTPGANGQNKFNALGSQVNPILLRALISILETKIGAAQ